MVLTDSTGVTDYVENGVTGLTVRMGTAIELKRAMEALLENENLRKSLAENGKRFAAIHCSEQSIAETFLRLGCVAAEIFALLNQRKSGGGTLPANQPAGHIPRIRSSKRKLFNPCFRSMHQRNGRR